MIFGRKSLLEKRAEIHRELKLIDAQYDGETLPPSVARRFVRLMKKAERIQDRLSVR